MGGETFYSVIASGDQAGGAVGIMGAKSAAVVLPTVTSGDFRLLGSVDGTNFYPTHTTSGRWARATAVGSAVIALSDDQLAYSHIKPEISVAQAGPRTLTVFAKW